VGGVISPLLANIYLNVLDTIWKVREVQVRIPVMANSRTGGWRTLVKHSEAVPKHLTKSVRLSSSLS